MQPAHMLFLFFVPAAGAHALYFFLYLQPARMLFRPGLELVLRLEAHDLLGSRARLLRKRIRP